MRRPFFPPSPVVITGIIIIISRSHIVRVYNMRLASAAHWEIWELLYEKEENLCTLAGRLYKYCLSHFSGRPLARRSSLSLSPLL